MTQRRRRGWPPRLVNRVVTAVLRSRGHRMLSGSIALLTVTHHRTGLPMTFPVMYAVDGLL